MPHALTVSQFVESIRGLLRETVGMVTVQGEVTGYRTARNSTLVYFELKDDASRVLCFALSHEVRVELTDGMEIRVTGSPSLFKGNGGFHLRVVEIALVGEGALRKQFELTKKRLDAEGLFRPERKRPLPEFPDVIGIVTSPDAAAYTDVLRILKNRWPLVRVKFAGVAVQGSGAARQIVRALNGFSSSHAADVVILTRGGGSLEDLQAFNDEAVARAIFASAVPVIVGVGHERDVTIADYVADVRASTPSNAAERIVPDRQEVLRRLDVVTGRLSRAVAGTIEVEGGMVRELTGRLGRAVVDRTGNVMLLVTRFASTAGSMTLRAERLAVELEHLLGRASQRVRQRLADARTRLSARVSLLQSLSPLAILKRGYSMTFRSNGALVRRSSELASGETLRTKFGEGEATSTVTHTS